MNHLPKSDKKTNRSRKTKKEQAQISSYYIRYIIIPSIILVIVLTAKLIIKTYAQPLVLGTSTYSTANNETEQREDPNTTSKLQKTVSNNKNTLKNENSLDT